jgi:hypothetical protein
MNKDDELICNFMNYEREWIPEKRKFWYQILDPIDKNRTNGFFDDELPFDKSWDYLIDVIKSLDKYQIYSENVLGWLFNPLNIKETYRKVVNIIDNQKYIQK